MTLPRSWDALPAIWYWYGFCFSHLVPPNGVWPFDIHYWYLNEDSVAKLG